MSAISFQDDGLKGTKIHDDLCHLIVSGFEVACMH